MYFSKNIFIFNYIFYTSKKGKRIFIYYEHSYDFYIGLCYLQLNEFTSSISFITNSLRYEKEHSRSGHFLEYFYLGIVNMEIENYVLALKYFDDVLTIYSNFSDAKYYKAKCYEALNKSKDDILLLYKEGLNDLKNGYTINEDNTLYEQYPYQITLRNFESAIKRINSIKTDK